MNAEPKPPTRADYMAGRVTFQEYYEAIAREAHVDMRRSALLPYVVTALARGDEYLNTIALPRWDLIAAQQRHAVEPALRAHGDGWSMAGGVCVAKAAARAAAREVTP